MTTDERITKLEAQAAYQERQRKRIVDALKSAAGHLMNVYPTSSLLDVISAIRSAAGQIMGLLK
jgi:hypothetical protein